MATFVGATLAAASTTVTADARFKSFKTMPFGEINRLQIPASAFMVRIHPRTDKVADAVNQFFLETWTFPGEKERKKCMGADFLCSLANSRDDRLCLVCEIGTHQFLVDDIIEEVSLKDSRAFNDKLIRVLCDRWWGWLL